MIPVCEPSLEEEDIGNVLECVRSGWISSSGSYLSNFEREWAHYCGGEYGIAVANGTVALELALSCLDLEPGSEVVVPTFTIISCALAIVRAQCVPVLVDTDPHTWQMDVAQIADKITSKTRAILPVHIYGHPVDMDPLLACARQYNLAVIEDAAEVHGAHYKGRTCGSLGDMSTFSFYANKLITTGEGGMVLTNSSDLAARARKRRNLCFEPERRFLHHELGYNFRMTNVQAALGVAQVRRIERIVARKRAIAAAYTERLQEVELLELHKEAPWARHVYWVYGVIVKEEAPYSVEDVVNKLSAEGIQTRPFFLGLHEQPVLQTQGYFHNEHYPVAERMAARGFYLPSSLSLTETSIDRITDTLKNALR